MSFNHSFIVAAALYFFVLLIGLMVLILIVRTLFNWSFLRENKFMGCIGIITFVGVVGVILLLAINIPNVISHLTQEDQYIAPTPQGFVPRLPGTPLPSCTGSSCGAWQVFDEYCNSLMTTGAVEPTLYPSPLPSQNPTGNTKIYDCSHDLGYCLSNNEVISVFDVTYEDKVTKNLSFKTFAVTFLRGADGWKIENEYLTPPPAEKIENLRCVVS
jgi:hypothetical protein